MEIGRGAGEGGPIQIEQCSCMHSSYKLGHGGQGRACNTALLSSTVFLAQFLKIHIKLVCFLVEGVLG